MNCKECPNYKFESGPSDYCPSNHGVMYCKLLHGETSCFTEAENRGLEKTGAPENCPLKKDQNHE